MIKKFTANCDFGGVKHPVTLYVGDPAIGSHPLNFQNRWLSESRGGIVPIEIMNSFSKLMKIAEKNRVSFQDLCCYVLEELQANGSIVQDAKQAHSISNKKQN